MSGPVKITAGLREKDRQEARAARRRDVRIRGASYLVNLGFYALLVAVAFLLCDIDVTTATVAWAATMLVIVAAATWLFRAISDR